MSEVVMTGLSAGTPIGFLAALGAFRHAAEMRDELGEVRLSWLKQGGGWFACLATDREVSAHEFLTAFVRRVSRLGDRSEFGWAEQIKKNSVEDFRKLVGEHPDCEDWFAAFASDLAVSNEGTLKSTDFDMTGGQQKFLLKLRDSSHALCSSTVETEALLREALFGPWLYKPSKKAIDVELSHSMGLDPSTLLQGAFTASEPASIKDKRGVRGAIWLGFEALPLFPCVVCDGRLRTVGFVRRKEKGDAWRSYLEWGVWESPLAISAVKTLLLQSREEWRRERGIIERFRSERINLNKDYYSLGAAELVV